jgi:hypothetical protein
MSLGLVNESTATTYRSVRDCERLYSALHESLPGILLPSLFSESDVSGEDARAVLHEFLFDLLSGSRGGGIRSYHGEHVIGNDAVESFLFGNLRDVIRYALRARF